MFVEVISFYKILYANPSTQYISTCVLHQRKFLETNFKYATSVKSHALLYRNTRNLTCRWYSQMQIYIYGTLSAYIKWLWIKHHLILPEFNSNFRSRASLYPLPMLKKKAKKTTKNPAYLNLTISLLHYTHIFYQCPDNFNLMFTFRHRKMKIIFIF